MSVSVLGIIWARSCKTFGTWGYQEKQNLQKRCVGNKLLLGPSSECSFCREGERKVSPLMWEYEYGWGFGS